MNKIEFNEVVKLFDIEDIYLYRFDEEVYFWNNLAIYFSGKYYTVISGKIPLIVMNNIYDKYKDNMHGIRIMGLGEKCIPTFYAINDEYKKEFNKLYTSTLTKKEIEDKMDKLKNKLNNVSDRDKYIKTCHVDSKEGFIILLNELNKYYGNKGIELKDAIMVITSNLLNKINPSTTTYEWMRDNKEFVNDYLKTSYLRDVLNRFDDTVNPFMNDELELKSINNYLDSVNIDINSYDKVQERYRKNCCSMTITDKNTSNKVNYYRSPDGFAYQLECDILNKSICISHYYDALGSVYKYGECVYITIYDKINKIIEYNKTFNLTHNLVIDDYDEKIDMTKENYEELISLLDKYTLISESITINNMIKNKTMELRNN